MKKILLFFTIVMWATAAGAKIVLPGLFQKGMVLQRGKPIPVWGKAGAGETVTVKLLKKQYTTTADGSGRWRIDLPSQKAGGPYIIEVKGDSQDVITLSDVYIGDVWLCSGQSNMDVTVERVYPQYTGDIDNYENGKIRLFRVENDTDTHGVKDDIKPTATNWLSADKKNAWKFSALGYYIGRQMYEATGVAQGIIVNSWGGTPIQAWISRDSLEKDYPMLIRCTQMFESDAYVKAQAKANEEAARQWSEILDSEDATAAYSAKDYDDTNWKMIDQNEWAWPGIGSVWLRQHVTIDKAHAGKPARLLLGTLFDQDITYLNGKEIGHTYYQYPPRRYDIAEGMLQEGDNVIAVRFINKYGAARFIKEKPYLIAFGEDRCSQNPMPKDVIKLSETWKQHDGADMPPCPSGDIALQNQATTLYNAVVHPLAPYAIGGVVWYQGESNTGNPAPYGSYLRKMKNCWRALWGEPQLPFVIVQLANFMDASAQPQPYSAWAKVREAQRTAAKEDPYAELAVTIDLGEAVDIHPLRKKEVAGRVALALQRLTMTNKVKLSPEVIGAEAAEGKVVLTLDQPIVEGRIEEMEVAGEDGVFRNVEATGRGNTIELHTATSAPLTIHYAWKDNPAKANVRSKSGLPMSPFEVKCEKR